MQVLIVLPLVSAADPSSLLDERKDLTDSERVAMGGHGVLRKLACVLHHAGNCDGSHVTVRERLRARSRLSALPQIGATFLAKVTT